jgi:ribonuclease PH|tara:strand:+ start:122 stop:829 length:708 start_codon:yes stop_codon:yes gene_type:complete
MRKSRNVNELRKIELIPNFSQYAEGSCLVKFGDTHVLCNASLDRSVPRWLKGQNKGWVTAEYGMLPRATHERVSREAKKGQQTGRTQEIQRLIGRSLRAIVDPSLFTEMQILVDCDVLQADGGTRTASISGAFVALHHCFESMIKEKIIRKNPIIENLAAISCGVIANDCYLDLDYIEDQSADVDANFVITDSQKLVEIQLTSEGKICEEQHFSKLLDLAKLGIAEIINAQKKVM